MLGSPICKVEATRRPPKNRRRRPLMKNRLPMRPNQSNRTQRHTPPSASSQRRRRKLLSQQKIQLADFSGGSRPAVGKPQNRAAHPRGKPHLMMSFEFHRKGRKSARKYAPSATSMPSAEVPDIIPSTRITPLSLEARKPQFTTAISQQVYTLPPSTPLTTPHLIVISITLSESSRRVVRAGIMLRLQRLSRRCAKSALDFGSAGVPLARLPLSL